MKLQNTQIEAAIAQEIVNFSCKFNKTYYPIGSVIDLRSSLSPVKPKTAFGRRESMVARPGSPEFNLDSIQTRTRNKTYTYDRTTQIPGVIEESNLCALDKSADLSVDTVLDKSPKRNNEALNKKSFSIQKIERSPAAKTRKERGSIDSQFESSPKPETKKTRVKLTKIKSGTKRNEKPANKAAKILRSNSQLLLVQDYLGNLPKGSIAQLTAITDRKEAPPVKRIVHQSSLPRFSLTDLGASPRTEAANKEIEELKSSGDLQLVEKTPYDSLMDLSLRKVPKPTPEKEEQIPKESRPTKKRATSLPKLLFRPMGSKKKLQEVSKVYQSSREENDKRFGSVKIRLERIKHSNDKTMPGDLTERSSVMMGQRENWETKLVGVDSAYQRILKSLRSSLVEVSQEKKMHMKKRKGSATQKQNLERTQSIGYFPVHLFTKRKNLN